jgi:imidazolonepropionase-like amidohydrolase
MRILILLLCSVAFVKAQVSTTVIDGLRKKTVRFVAYVNCTAIPEPGKKIDSAVILVRGEHIVSVAAGTTIPAGADVRDLKGAWVYAGFVDPFVDVNSFSSKSAKAVGHAGYEEDDDGSPSRPPQTGAHYWNEAVRPERKATDNLSVDAEQAKDWTAIGILAASVASHDGIFSGSNAAIIMRQGSAAQIVLADAVTQNLSFRKGSSSTPYPTSQMGSIALIRQSFIDADWYGKAHATSGAPNAKLPETNISLDALNRAVKANTPFVASAQDEHDIGRWSRIAKEAGVRLIFKGSGLEYRRSASIASIKAEWGGLDIITPLSFPEVPDVSDPVEARAVSLTDLIHWYWAADNAHILDSIGYRVAFTTDGLKDKGSYLKNIRLCVNRGLDSNKALAAITTVPSELSGVSSVVGSIAPKKIANLVVMSGPLFNEESTIRSIVVAGDEHVLEPPTTVDIRGTWNLSSNAVAKQLTVEISGKPEKPSAIVKIDTIIVPSTISLKDNRVVLTINFDTLGIAGLSRVVVQADSILMQGELLLPDGKTASFVMNRTKPFTPNKEENRNGEDRREKAEARRGLPGWLPLGPFGFEKQPGQETVVLKNATVWTSSDKGVLQGTDVLLANGKIAGVGKGLTADKTIDCSGMHITPGIIDEHSHIAISRGVNEGAHAVTTEVRIGDVLDPDDINIYRQITGGVTASHLLHGSANPMGGQLQFIRLRWGADAEGLKWQGAKPTVKFALGENVKQSNWGDRFTVRYPQSRMGVEEIMRDAFRAAREYEQELSAASLGGVPVRRDLQLDALVEILNNKRNIHCHSYVQSEILMLMRLAEEFGFRVHTFTHILEGYKVASEMAKHGAMASTFSDWWAYKFEVYDAIPENPAIMHDNGVVVSVNSDDPEMARRLNQEAGKSVAYGGVSEEEALKFCTLNSAKQMGIDDVVGSVETGKDADVVVWSGNPLSNHSRVEHTFIEGRHMFSREADEQMRTRDSELRRYLEQEALKASEKGSATTKTRKVGKREYHCDTTDDEMK